MIFFPWCVAYLTHLEHFIQSQKNTVRAITYCDLLVLGKNDFDNVMMLYPEFFQSLQKVATLKGKTGWSRVRETLKLARAIRMFGGDIEVEELLLNSFVDVNEEILPNVRGDQKGLRERSPSLVDYEQMVEAGDLIPELPNRGSVH